MNREQLYQNKLRQLMIRPVLKKNERPMLRQRFRLLRNLHQWTCHLLNKLSQLNQHRQ